MNEDELKQYHKDDCDLIKTMECNYCHFIHNECKVKFNMGNAVEGSGKCLKRKCTCGLSKIIEKYKPVVGLSRYSGVIECDGFSPASYEKHENGHFYLMTEVIGFIDEYYIVK